MYIFIMNFLLLSFFFVASVQISPCCTSFGSFSFKSAVEWDNSSREAHWSPEWAANGQAVSCCSDFPADQQNVWTIQRECGKHDWVCTPDRLHSTWVLGPDKRIGENTVSEVRVPPGHFSLAEQAFIFHWINSEVVVSPFCACLLQCMSDFLIFKHAEYFWRFHLWNELCEKKDNPAKRIYLMF